MSNFLKYILFPSLGFGLGGLLWGWHLFAGLPQIDYPLTLIGAIFLGFFGGLGLSILSKNVKRILKTCGLGIFGCMLGVFVAFLGIYFLLLSSSFLLEKIVPESIIPLIKLKPSLKVGAFWANFFITGLFIGLFFSPNLKKIFPMLWRGAVGFSLGAIIAPIFGNLLGGLVNSLFASYLITFSLIGIILGLFLGWGIYQSEKAKT